MKLPLQGRLSWVVSVFAFLLGVWLLWPGGMSHTSAAPQANAFVRVVHASPDAGNVDVFVDGKSILTNFVFSTVTDYVPLAAGAHKLQVAPTGKGVGGAAITQSVSVDPGMYYTVAALGTRSSGFSLSAFVDDNRLTGGEPKVRVYHLSPNAGPVNVAVGGKTVITGLTYPKASAYLPVPAGSYTFDVTATSVNATVPVAATLKQGTVNSVFALGLYKGTPALKFVLASAKGI
ncbi:DUF4397 domain-containing protein [Tengunoibacter tsumagoiensis]|uniref:DUF4397 domain-containing protein n=1 Tax=Tengunoibacter tsumagoiensis TaxID=2014871 RepID=A0A401ZYG5_9CHLR|nr:DUF4397 domain-containing protein [Tengunoibacter tsumagoiensis]GCE11896.1 hypothetical protein KTT_17550 [Tengunoibacter tsumagoiensis]